MSTTSEVWYRSLSKDSKNRFNRRCKICCSKARSKKNRLREVWRNRSINMRKKIQTGRAPSTTPLTQEQPPKRWQQATLVSSSTFSNILKSRRWFRWSASSSAASNFETRNSCWSSCLSKPPRSKNSWAKSWKESPLTLRESSTKISRSTFWN